MKFSGHGGALEILVREPLLRVTEAHLELAVKHTWSDDRDPIVAAVSAVSRVDEGIPIALALTASGSRMLGSVYPVGTALDPATVIADDSPHIGETRSSTPTANQRDRYQ